MTTLKPVLRSHVGLYPQAHGTSTNNPCALWGFSDEFTEFKGGETRRRHGHFQEAQMARNNHQEAIERTGETARAGVCAKLPTAQKT